VFSILINKIAELEGAKGPSPGSQSRSVPPVPAEPDNLFKNLPRSQPILPPERKLNVVIYGLEENPSNTTRQDRLPMDVKSAISEATTEQPHQVEQEDVCSRQKKIFDLLQDGWDKATPTTECTLTLFITHLATSNVLLRTIKVYLVAIRHMYVCKGLQNHYNHQVTPRFPTGIKGD